MTSQKHIEANRINAQKSTGPTTEKGKAIVARNATRHGILSQHVPLNEVEFEQYAEFSESMHKELQPRDVMQSFLADRIISTAWRLRRVVYVETLMLQKAEKSYCSSSYREAFEGRSADYMAILARYERSLENALFRALKEFKALKEQKDLEICSLRI